MSRHHRRSKTVLLAAVVLAAVLALASCSSTGGRPRSSGNGMAAGTADTPRVTVAMITHGVPGNAFWDLVRKGAETAAAKDNIDLRYSADPEAPNQANLVQAAIDSKVAGIALTLAKPDAMAPAVKAALAAGIVTLLKDPARRMAMGEAGRERVVAEFSIERMVDGTLAAYRSRGERGEVQERTS